MLLRDNVYQAIRRAIVECELHPGQELREQTLADKYRVSRSPVRDALLRLELERFVTVLPRQGYVVNPVTVHDTEELYGLRRLIEPCCAAAAARQSDAELQTLQQFRRQSDQMTHFETYPEYHRAFHQSVAALAPNRRIGAIASELVDEAARALRLFVDQFAWPDVQWLLDGHEAIIDALQHHDAGRAQSAVVEHLDKAGHHVLNLVRSLEGAASATVDEQHAAAE